LFLDNCSAHPSEDELVSADGKITALLLLMEQGVLESMKRVYRKSIVRDLIEQSTLTIEDFLKRTKIKKIVISSAWDMVKPS